MLLITIFWFGTIALLIRQVDINNDLKNDINNLESMLADKQNELDNAREIIEREGL